MGFATVAPTITDVPALRVSTRSAWTDSWLELDYAQPLRVTNVAAPGISSAVIQYDYGSVKREDATSFANVNPLDLKGFFVKIEAVTDPGGSETVEALFYGYVPAETIRPDSSYGDTDQASGVYFAEAYGLEYLLDNRKIYGAATDAGTSGAFASIRHTPVFNEQTDRGLSSAGNRSTSQLTIGSGATERTAYVFSNDGEFWTGTDIAEYVLEWFGAGPSSGDMPHIELGGQFSLLAYWQPVRMDLEGLTVREALNRVIDRRRGVGWCIRVIEDPEGTDVVDVHVFSTIGTSVTEDTITIAANTEIFSLTLDDNIRIQNVSLKIEQHSKYGWVYVRGAPLTSVFTLSMTIHLEEGWSAAEQTAYDAATDEARSTDKYRHVYTRFVVPDDYDFLANVNPTVELDGTVDTLDVAPMRVWGRKLLRQLPLVKPATRDGGALIESEFREPFAVMKHPAPAGAVDPQYLMIDRLEAIGLPSANVRMLDHGLGVEILPPFNHAFALNNFSGDSQNLPAVDYTTLEVTVAMETDEHLRYVSQIAGSSEPDRILYIDIPDAQLWIIKDGTITDIANDGSLIEQSGNAVLRTDVARLKSIAALAKAWYSVQRGVLSYDYEGVLTSFPVGGYIGTVLAGGYVEDVESPITAVSYNLTDFSTSIATGFEELDLEAFARGRM